jgi:cyclophilin family peptidyl-prolyl cis-trans isomerase
MPNRTAAIQTNKGTIKFELLESDAPKTTENFIT